MSNYIQRNGRAKVTDRVKPRRVLQSEGAPSKTAQFVSSAEERLKDSKASIAGKAAQFKSAHRGLRDGGNSRKGTLAAPKKSQPAQAFLALESVSVVTQLARGRLSRVFLVRSKQRQNNYYAMKVYKKSDVLLARQDAAVVRERKLLGGLHDNPFVVSMYQSAQDDQNLYLMLEYAIGGDLFGMMQRGGKLSDEEARFVGAEVALALEHLHKLNIVYRNIKPEHVCFTKAGHVKLIDFAGAKRMVDEETDEPLQLTHSICGAPEYTAPEMLRAQGHTKAVDWWSFGVLLYEMLAGYPPFIDDLPDNVYASVLEGRYRLPGTFDPAVKDLIKKLLVVDPAARLGNLRAGSEEVRLHPWFKSIIWTAAEQLRLKVPKRFVGSPAGEGDHTAFPQACLEASVDHSGPEVDPYHEYFKNF